MRQEIKRKLVAAAIEARRHAVAPYSSFPVGAALLANDGRIIGGANVESISYGLTCCAERVALFKALTEGISGFAAIAVVARYSNGPTPCGACRQLLVEFAPHATVLLVDSARPARVRQFSVKELLPAAFSDWRTKSKRGGVEPADA
jgi:cytidine deaminase